MNPLKTCLTAIAAVTLSFSALAQEAQPLTSQEQAILDKEIIQEDQGLESVQNEPAYIEAQKMMADAYKQAETALSEDDLSDVLIMFIDEVDRLERMKYKLERSYHIILFCDSRNYEAAVTILQHDELISLAQEIKDLEMSLAPRIIAAFADKMNQAQAQQ